MAQVVSREGPTAEYIDARVSEAEDRDGKRNAAWDRIETLRFRQHSLPVPENYKKFSKEVKAPLIDDVLRTVVTGITQSFFTFNVPPQAFGKNSQANTTLREKWLTAAFRKMDRAGGRHRAYVDAIDQAATFGLAVPKIVYLPNAWDNDYLAKEYETLATEQDDKRREHQSKIDDFKAQSPIPFAWMTPDPRTYHDWTHYRKPYEVVEISVRNRAMVAERYKDVGVRFDSQSGQLRKSGKRLGKLDEPVAETALGKPGLAGDLNFQEHWLIDDREKTCWVTYKADGVVLDAIETEYYRMPYFPFFGLSTASNSPEYEAQSVVGDMLDLVEAYDLLLTMWLNYGFISAFPMGTYEQAPNQTTLTDPAGAALAQIEFEPGVFKVMPQGAKMGWVVMPPGGSDMKQMSEVLRELTERAGGVPPILRGEMKGDSTAWGQAQALYVATRRIFDPISDNYAGAAEEMGEFVQWGIEHKHHDTVYVMATQESKRGKKHDWLGLGPKDIDNYYTVSVEISTLTQDRRIQEGQFGLQQQQAGAISMEEHRTDFLHIGSPEETDRKVKREQFEASQQYVEFVWSKIMEAWTRKAAANNVSAMPGQMTPEEQALAGMQAPQTNQAPPMSPEQAMMAQQAGIPGGMQQAGGAPPGNQVIEGAPAPMAPTPGLGIQLVPPTGGSVI